MRVSQPRHINEQIGGGHSTKPNWRHWLSFQQEKPRGITALLPSVIPAAAKPKIVSRAVSNTWDPEAKRDPLSYDIDL